MIVSWLGTSPLKAKITVVRGASGLQKFKNPTEFPYTAIAMIR